MRLSPRRLTPRKVSGYLQRHWRDFVRETEYDAENRRFIAGPRDQRGLRSDLVAAFLDISTKISCSHAESDILRIADFILRLPANLPGDIVECGVFKGGASCKLSLVAAATGRRLVLCDSFQGFPEGAEGEDSRLSTGDKLGTLEEVRENVSKYGEPSVVEFVPGWLEDTLSALQAANRPLVAVFEDTDLYDAVSICIKNLYPLLQPGCRVFTHDGIFPAALAAYRDRAVWASISEPLPPKLVIVRKTIFHRTGSLGYVQKPKVREQAQVG